MSLLSKLRVPDRQAVPVVMHGRGAAMVAEARAGRPSNGLKEFVWLLDGIEHGKLLDLGPVWQATVSFFVERGFRVYTEDLLAAWKLFLNAEEERLRSSKPDESPEPPGDRARRFLEANLQYPAGTFDAVLVWDAFDYVESEAVTRLVVRLGELLREGGVVLALFHSSKPQGFHRYRVLDVQTLELMPAAAPCAVQRSYQNREILNLFARFHSSKTFVGRDQLREGVFIK